MIVGSVLRTGMSVLRLDAEEVCATFPFFCGVGVFARVFVFSFTVHVSEVNHVVLWMRALVSASIK